MRWRKAFGFSANSRPASRAAVFRCAVRRASITGVSRERHGASGWCGASEAGQHRQILAGAELVAQALGFLRPDLAEPRPQRFDQIHLVAMLDHAPAQIVQMLGIGSGQFSGISCRARR